MNGTKTSEPKACENPPILETDVYGRLRGLLKEAWQRRVSLRHGLFEAFPMYTTVSFAVSCHWKPYPQSRRLVNDWQKVLDNLRRDKGWSVVLRVMICVYVMLRRFGERLAKPTLKNPIRSQTKLNVLQSYNLHSVAGPKPLYIS